MTRGFYYDAAAFSYDDPTPSEVFDIEDEVFIADPVDESEEMDLAAKLPGATTDPEFNQTLTRILRKTESGTFRAAAIRPANGRWYRQGGNIVVELRF